MDPCLQSCVSDLILARAGETPGAIALLDLKQRVMTFDGLALQLETVKGALRQIDIGLEDRVAIVLPNGPELAAAFLTIAASTASRAIEPCLQPERV